MLCGSESCINHHFHLVVEFHCAHDKKPGPPALGPGPLIPLRFYVYLLALDTYPQKRVLC